MLPYWIAITPKLGKIISKGHISFKNEHKIVDMIEKDVKFLYWYNVDE